MRKGFIKVGLLLMSLVIGARADGLEIYLSLSGENSGDQFGISVSGAGDVNGDGYADFMVGADANDDGGTSSGKVYLYLGSYPPDAVPDLTFVGEPGDFLGVSVSGAGDVNGDGYSDIIVGAHFNSDAGLRAGKACLYLGGPSMDSIPDLVFHGEREKDYFGISVSGAGDLNGDGYDDFVIGAYKYDVISGGDTLENVGRAYVFFGGVNIDTLPDLVLTGKTEGERFGRAVSGAGDLNGDGYDDLIIGAYGFDYGGSFNVGRAYIFFGGPDMDTLPDLMLVGESAYSYFGWSLAGAGDLNGDGYSDVVVGAYGYSGESGKVYVFYGGSPMDSVPDVQITSSWDSIRFGYSVAGAGDIDNNGYDDLLIGADGDDSGGVDAGKVFVYTSDAGGLTLDTVLVGGGAGYLLGYSVGGAGDVNGDLNSDFLAGAMGADSYSGKAFLCGIPGAPSESNFIRGDVNGDFTVNPVDIVLIANYLYGGGFTPACLDAADVNDDGQVSYSDLSYLAEFLYSGGSQPPSPYPGCGSDPTGDSLHCSFHPCGTPQEEE